MNWFYVDDGKQAGPVDDLQLQELASSGKVQSDTLVWREGMANWQPYSQVVPAGTPLQSPPPPTTPAAPVLGPDEVVCTECQRVFFRQETIAYGTVNVCANCKPIFLQKLSEGVATGARRGRRTLPVDPNALIAEIQSRGYEVNIGSCISRAWALIKANFWLAIGATFLVMLCNQAAGFVPILGIFVSLALSGPLMGGLNIFFLKLIRGERAELGDAFSGFSSSFGRLCGTFLLMMVVVYAAILPGIILLFTSMGLGRMGGGGGGNAPSVLALALVGIGVVVVVYFGVAFAFALALAADLQLSATNALRVSFRVVNMKWFTVFGLMVVATLVNILGFFACIIGLLVTVPLFYAATLYAYEDIFGAQA